MDMKLNSAAVKALRKNKLWSQEELATACGVSLRTIQRLEGEGRGSAETLKALASVFEIDHEQLKEGTHSPRDYLNIQLGFVLIMIFLVIILFISTLFSQGFLNLPIFIVTTLSCVALSVVFSTLTTRVYDSKIEWHFTLGILRKTVLLSDVLSSKTVRNKVWWGLGIRLTPHGWLYCVSGLDAVSLRLADGRKVRIGTDEPNELHQAIEDARAAG